MTDQVFGELDFDGFYWNGHINLDFFGEERQLNLIVDSSFGEQTEVSELQHAAYHSFLEKWPGLQEAVMQEVIRYYNEEERFAYGPDDPKEFAAWWPEIETVEEMCKWVTLETVALPSDGIMRNVYDGKRCLYLLFSRDWAEDPNNNGVGIQLLDEEIAGIGYQSIAF